MSDQNNSRKFYLTTTLPYVNAEPHIGFAMEIVQADFICRYKKLKGYEVIFNTGTDEHGSKIYTTAQAQGKEPQEYVDEYAAKFDELKKHLNLSYTNFIRTSNPDHKAAAQEFWKRCMESGDIYKKLYKVKYCVGCELEKSDSELMDGKCPIHPNLIIEFREEENYFFKWSNYQKPLLEFYENNPEFVLPEFKYNEIKEFVKAGLNDFSISRLKSKLPWGVEVPGDPEQVMYVWFDALVNYISTLGWPKEDSDFSSFWPGMQMAGKDNLRQQSAMWQAMLMSAKIPNSKQIVIHGFITNNGQKMSKSLGNVIAPFELVDKYGIDGTRFLIGHELNTFEDSDVTPERLDNSYHAHLSNGLGNLIARVAKLCENSGFEASEKISEFDPEVERLLAEYKFNEALAWIWKIIQKADLRVNETKPWKLEGLELKEVLDELVSLILDIAYNLQPFLPETSEKILKQFSGKVTSGAGLFPRI